MLSNQYVATSASLSNTTAALKTAQDQIADLEAQNQALDQQVVNMTNTIANLSTQIAETQMKLVESETNNAFLENELKRQVAEKADLERKFNNLSQVRAQVRKLRDDLLIARRLQWMRDGTDPNQQRKGAQLLMARAIRDQPDGRAGALRFERRSQFRWLGAGRSDDDQRAGHDQYVVTVTRPKRVAVLIVHADLRIPLRKMRARV